MGHNNEWNVGMAKDLKTWNGRKIKINLENTGKRLELKMTKKEQRHISSPNGNEKDWKERRNQSKLKIT